MDYISPAICAGVAFGKCGLNSNGKTRLLWTLLFKLRRDFLSIIPYHQVSKYEVMNAFLTIHYRMPPSRVHCYCHWSAHVSRSNLPNVTRTSGYDQTWSKRLFLALFSDVGENPYPMTPQISGDTFPIFTTRHISGETQSQHEEPWPLSWATITGSQITGN